MMAESNYPDGIEEFGEWADQMQMEDEIADLKQHIEELKAAVQQVIVAADDSRGQEGMMEVKHGQTWIEVDGLFMQGSPSIGAAETAVIVKRIADTLAAAPDMAKRIEELEAALAFYAAPTTWYAVSLFSDPPAGDIMEDLSETALGMKPGKLARETLAGAEEGNVRGL
jgi:hypothetical protein